MYKRGKSIRLSIAVLSFVLCAQFGSQDNGLHGGGKPKVNFYGTITDSSDKTFEAENIVVEGLYKQIPVYQVPPKTISSSYDPSDNVARLDLAEIGRITIDYEQPILTIKNRKYLIITVFSKKSSKAQLGGASLSSHKNSLINDYLIEADKRLNCDESNLAGPIEKEIRFKALKEVVIKGYKQGEIERDEKGDGKVQKKETVYAAQARSSLKKQFIAQVQRLLKPLVSARTT